MRKEYCEWEVAWITATFRSMSSTKRSFLRIIQSRVYSSWRSSSYWFIRLQKDCSAQSGLSIGIGNGWVAIKRYLQMCYSFKRNTATPCIPLMAPLLRPRLITFRSPFAHVGLDFFCPCNITIYLRKFKRYTFCW